MCSQLTAPLNDTNSQQCEDNAASPNVTANDPNVTTSSPNITANSSNLTANNSGSKIDIDSVMVAFRKDILRSLTAAFLDATNITKDAANGTDSITRDSLNLTSLLAKILPMEATEWVPKQISPMEKSWLRITETGLNDTNRLL